MIEYASSEELQRHQAELAAQEAVAKTVRNDQKNKVKAVIEKHIEKHKSTDFVRKEAKENKRTAEYQLDLSADIVVILEKINKELR